MSAEMKMFVGFLILLFFVSCGKEGGQSRANISVNIAEIVEGVPAGGGLYLVGTNLSTGSYFSTALRSAGQEIRLELENGPWKFGALVWSGNSAGEAMSGDLRCGAMEVNLTGGDFELPIGVSFAGCLDAGVSTSAYLGSDGQLPPVEIVSCLVLGNAANYNGTNACENQGLQYFTGANKSFRIEASGSSNINLGVESMSSRCFNIGGATGMSSSVADTNVRVPIESNLFNFTIKAFERDDCVISETDKDVSAFYPFSRGIGNNSLSAFGIQARAIVVNNGLKNRLYLADNYLGNRNDALIGIVPYVHCTYNEGCISGDTIQNFNNSAHEMARETIVEVFGASDGKRSHERAAQALFPSSATPAIGGWCQGLSIVVDENLAIGTDGNLIRVKFSAGSDSATYDVANKILDVYYTSGTSCSNVANTINTYLGGQFKAILAPGESAGALSGSFAGTTLYPFGDGKNYSSQSRADHGLVADFYRDMLIGGWNAILYDEGLRSCQDYLNARGGAPIVRSFDFVQETFTITIEHGQGTIPAHFSKGGELFDVRVTFNEASEGDVGFIEFRCDAKVAWGRLVQEKLSVSEKYSTNELFWNFDPNHHTVEAYQYHRDLSKSEIDRSFIRAQKLSDNTFKMWKIGAHSSGIQQSAQRGRAMLSGDGKLIYASQSNFVDFSDTIADFSTDSHYGCVDLSTAPATDGSSLCLGGTPALALPSFDPGGLLPISTSINGISGLDEFSFSSF